MPSVAERPIAVFKISPIVIAVSVFIALLLQVSLPVKVPVARLFDLPLLLTIYFTLLRRNKIFGTLLGTVIGLLQDAFSHGLIGMFGMAKALVGYLAAWASVRFDTERMTSRIFLTAVLVSCHSLEITGLQHVLMEYPPPFIPLDLASTVLLNSALALVIFPFLDRLKRPA
jgi:rod shape-determining protein MreD